MDIAIAVGLDGVLCSCAIISTLHGLFCQQRQLSSYLSSPSYKLGTPSLRNKEYGKVNFPVLLYGSVYSRDILFINLPIPVCYLNSSQFYFSSFSIAIQFMLNAIQKKGKV